MQCITKIGRSRVAACALGAGVIALAGLAGLGGCAADSHAARRRGGPCENERADTFTHGHVYPDSFVGNQATSCEMVFSSPYVVQRLAGADESAMSEYWRNDSRLGVRDNGPLLATTQWPQAEQPSLDYYRQFTINTNANSVTYFRTQSEAWGYGGYGRWYGGSGAPVWYWR